MPKYTAHIPTEQYGFIEVQSDNLEEIVDEYTFVKEIFKEKEGYNQKDWARVRNKYITSNTITPETLEKCNKWQRLVINEVKKTFKSLK